jgi:transcriptional regulator with XRE-family HTH domain
VRKNAVVLAEEQKATYSEKIERFAWVARELRRRAGLTLQDVSKASGLAVSTVSKMENGQLSPTYETILRLADGMGVDVSELFDVHLEAGVASSRRSVTRRGNGMVHSSPQYRYEMLSAELSRKAFLPFHATIKAHGIMQFPELPHHPGEEFFYVISGIVVLHTDHYEPVMLEPGDSCYFDSSMGHALVSATKEDAEVLWIVSHPSSPTRNAVTETSSLNSSELRVQTIPSARVKHHQPRGAAKKGDRKSGRVRKTKT